MKLGINGMGRIGKLTLWHHLARGHFDEFVVNLGRTVGSGLHDLAQTVEKDSTYGRLSQFLHGIHAKPAIERVDEADSSMIIAGKKVRFLLSARNPREIPWRAEGVRLVVDTTGAFLDPTTPADAPGGALRGHLEAGAEKVLLSAPFKIKNKELKMPPDALTTVMGINEESYDPAHHRILSAASCTTTCLAFMVKPLLDHFGIDRLLSANMVTVHAATSSQSVLDAVPAAGTKDLRKSRAVMNNVILTTTGAAKALPLVIPEMAEIGFLAESVRIPVSTGSLTILSVNLQADGLDTPITRTEINRLYREAAEGPYRGHLVYSEEQNVSSDVIGHPNAATIIEAQEVHTRTAFVRLDLDRVPGLPEEVKAHLVDHTARVPVTQAVIYGWYDNELGSYANMLGEMTVHVAEKMF